MVKKALKMGGIAAVGALAYAAYQRYSSGKGAANSALSQSAEAELVAAPKGSAFMPAKMILLNSRSVLGRQFLYIVLVALIVRRCLWAVI
jgi:uncharacterized membrane protein YebE (DUF533 family)